MSNYKIVVTAPEDDADALRQVIGDVGGGRVGNYTHCSFSVKGTGRFLATSGAKPTIGSVGQPEAVLEERIEINCTDKNMTAVIAAIRQAHPYEEPVIDVYTLTDLSAL